MARPQGRGLAEPIITGNEKLASFANAFESEIPSSSDSELKDNKRDLTYYTITNLYATRAVLPSFESLIVWDKTRFNVRGLKVQFFGQFVQPKRQCPGRYDKGQGS